MASWGVAAGGGDNLVLRCGHKAPAAPLAVTKQGKANTASRGAATEGLGVKEEEGGPQGARQAAVQAVSRHRARYLPPSSTPPGFWNLGFPDSP
ncbi:predicted protein [Haematococcus lacustris]|uniref:DNA endonuclease activator Ctp1 C-terminal domain-containing protein n=1 Tax=Haematococcus lacustris TaxID=44745 RepID=A0A699YYL4_HAELA|nr:predicted protein [Haematococcus lacustris]